MLPFMAWWDLHNSVFIVWRKQIHEIWLQNFVPKWKAQADKSTGSICSGLRLLQECRRCGYSGYETCMLSIVLKALKALCTFNIWEVEVFNHQRTLLTYRGHWETLIAMVVMQAECRKWTCTHTETCTLLGSKHHAIWGKNNPLKISYG